mmetsp:Transcript_169455/g.411973  ORF Transcript_169455/g.411973 Transcript_169455/m.411973 type:complete len:219 (-) Transcript_169455:245-901(-)
MQGTQRGPLRPCGARGLGARGHGGHAERRRLPPGRRQPAGRGAARQRSARHLPEPGVRSAHGDEPDLRRARRARRPRRGPLVSPRAGLGHPLARGPRGHGPADLGAEAAHRAPGAGPEEEGRQRERRGQQRRQRQRRQLGQRQQQQQPLPAAPVRAQAADGGGARPGVPGRAGADLPALPRRDLEARRHLLRRSAREAHSQEVPRAEREVERGLDGGY